MNQTGTIGKVHSNNYSFWLQDSWSPSSRLTINAGVRIENENVPNYKDKTQDPDALDIKFPFKDKIAPRFGFAYDIKGDGKWKAYGSFGTFYDMMKLALPRGSFGGDHWVDYAWTLNSSDYASISCGEGTSGCPGTFIGQVDYRHAARTRWIRSSSRTSSIPGMTGIDPDIEAGAGTRDHRPASTTS